MRIIYFIGLALILLTGCRFQEETSQSIENEQNAKRDFNVKNDKISKTETAKYQKKLKSLFDSNLVSRKFNGAILIAKGGNILYEAYSGFKNPSDKKNPIDENTAFHLASTSKPFTAIAILRMVQDGKLKLDDPVTRFFPAFPYPSVTVKQLLSHRSGLPNYLYFMDDKAKWDPAKMVTNQDVLNFMELYKPPQYYTSGTHFSYCNTNFVLLALIIEKISGISYPEYLQQTIFEPLEMTNTFVFTPADSFRAIMSYRPSGAEWPNEKFEYTYGDKNIYSTPRDMLKWDRALYNEKFISKSLLDSAYTPLSNESPSIHNYGLGWRMLNLANGKKVIYHFGKWHGFTPAFARLLDEKAVIIIVGNTYNENIYASAKLAYNIFGDYMQGETTDEEETPIPVNPIVLQPVVKNEKPINNVKKLLKPTIAKTESKKTTKPIEKKAILVKKSEAKPPALLKKK